MCSFPRPRTVSRADGSQSRECALLQHSELVSLFHELGHGMHDLVARTQYSRFHGPRSPPDFFEVPSIMLENWCWLRDELREMSCHFSATNSGGQTADTAKGIRVDRKTIPDDLLDGLVKSRHVDRAAWFLRQLAFARFDMAIHNPRSREECLNLDPSSIFNGFMESLRLLPCPDPEARGHPEANFQHLVSGMDAGYYSYLSSHVIAADIFQNNFAEDPRSRDTWDRYRKGILEHGASRDELGLLEQFLGHKPSPEYLLESLKFVDSEGRQRGAAVNQQVS